MSDALNSGVSGLQANQQMLDVIGNNLANSNTTGFKSQSVNFADLVYQNLKGATSGSGTTGGTDPIQVGSGVAVASIETDQQQGTLQQTGNQLDMALQGNGYFVAQNDGAMEFTRAGSFGVNANNILIDPSTGYAIQRFGTVGQGSATSPAFQTAGNNDITIPTNNVIPGSATSNITLQGNLSASASGPLAQVLTSAQPFTSAGAPATLTTTLDSLTDNIAPYGAGDTITLSGTDVAGSAVNASISVDPAVNGGPFTMQDLITAINNNFPGSTASLDTSGNLVLTSNTTGANNLSLSITDGTGGPNPSGGGTNWSDQTMAVTTTGQAGTTVDTSIQVYDPQGTAHTLNLTFQKDATNTWSLTGTLAASDGTVTSGVINNITFNQNGTFSQVNGPATMAVQFNGFAAPQTLSFNFGTANGTDGVTQNGGTSSAAATGQDGFSTGSLSSLSIGQDGTINGVFTNGETMAIAQLAVANFANPGALTRVGNNYYTASGESGTPLIGAGQSGGRGSIQQGQLEGSNVDVSQEFTLLIIAQQGYSVNAHVITAADQMLQDLTNILR